MSSTGKGFSEKRDFIRMKISAPLSAKLSSGEGVIDGLCRDLSGGGMQVDSPIQIPLGTELVVEISSDHGHSPTLHARAKVARSAPGPIEGFNLGLEILEILK